MSKFRKSKFNKGPINLVKLIPNFITILALCIGLNSIRFAFDEKWEQAVLCILVAGILDGFDGRIARLLKASTDFGAELDSLADFLNFGLAPVMVTYLWIHDDYRIKIISWGALMFFAVCASVRLARFNSLAAETKFDQKLLKKYFLGVPSPLAAMLVLLPVINEFDIAYHTGFSLRTHGFMIAIYQVLIGVLMASTFPTFSFKYIHVERKYISIIFASMTLFCIIFYLFTWYVIPVLSVMYLCTIFFSIRSWKKDILSLDI